MNLNELKAKASHIEELNVISLEGGDFVMEAKVDGRPHPISDAKGERLKVHSLLDAQRLFSGLPAVPTHLVQWAEQDEMCGMNNDLDAGMKMPLPRRSAW